MAIKEFRWNKFSDATPTKHALAKTRKSFKLSRIGAEILWRRGVTPSGMKKYLFGSYKDLYSPYLFKDMMKAATRILQAVRDQEKVMIHGDYDVDGITSTALLKMMFDNIGVTNVRPFCPTRAMGYGLSKSAVELAIKEKRTLLLTCDCGSNETGPLALARKNGIDVIVLDHHAFKKRPKVLAFINTREHFYPFDGLCGAGVVFKLMQAVNNEIPTYPEQYLDFVALATIADSAPIMDENRILVKLGLKQMSLTQNTGLRNLLHVCGFLQRKITSEVVGFIIAPKINAPGRMSSPKIALDLFLTLDEKEAETKARKLAAINKKRIEKNHQIRDEAIQMVEELYQDDRFLVLSNDSWSKGIIGIVASTIVEIYHKPCCILSNGYGSVRTVPEFPLLEPLGECSAFFHRWGGHPMAAGVHVKKTKVDAFRKKINQIAEGKIPPKPVPYMIFDTKIRMRDVNMKLVEELERLEPFGLGNPLPYFVMEDVVIARNRITNDQQHLQLSFRKDGYLTSSVGFWMAPHHELILDPAQKFDVLFMLERHRDNYEQVIIKDLKEVPLNW